MIFSLTLTLIIIVGALAIVCISGGLILGWVRRRRQTHRLGANVPGITGRWVASMEDNLPSNVRLSADWSLAKTQAEGMDESPANELERMSLILRWMWDDVLPLAQESAAERGYGDQWRHMCEARSPAVAGRTSTALRASTFANTKAVGAAAFVAANAARAAESGDHTLAADRAAAVTRDMAVAAVRFHPNFWNQIAPAQLLRQLAQV